MIRALLHWLWLPFVLGVVRNDKGPAGAAGAPGEKGEPGAPGGVPKFLFGQVTAAGEKLGGSSGWTVALIEAGVYKITITAPFAANCVPVATANTEARIASCSSLEKGAFRVTIVTTAGAKTSTNFTFHVTGE